MSGANKCFAPLHPLVKKIDGGGGYAAGDELFTALS